MRSVWLLAMNDLRLTARDRAAFFWILVFPVFLMWIFGQMTGGGSDQIALAVIDEDGGWLARSLVDELPDESVALVEMTREDWDAKEDRTRCLVIPEGFTAGALAGEQQTLRLEKEAGSSAEFGLAGQAHIVRAIARALAVLIEMHEAGSLSGPDAEETFEALGERPPLVALDVDHAGSGRPVPRGYQQSVPGTLTMVVLMMTLIYGAVFLTIEKREGMLRRQVSLPMSRSRIYLGKLAGRMLIAVVQIVIMLLAGSMLFGLSLDAAPFGLGLLLVSYAAAVAALATLLGAVVRTPAQASAVGWLSSMVMAGLGGAWWPSELMPRWLWSAAHLLPTAWAMDGFHALISFGRGFEAALLPAAVLLGFAAVFSVAGGRLLRYEG